MKIKSSPRSPMGKREIKVEQFKRMIFHNFQKREKYCDLTVLSADGATRIKVHRVILEAKINKLEAFDPKSMVLQTAMESAVLQKIVHYCYTDEICFEGVSQTSNLLKFSNEFGINDLAEKCREYLNSINAVEPQTPAPPTNPHKLIIFGGLSDTCFSGAMLTSLDGNWEELPRISGSKKYSRPVQTSAAYCGRGCVVVCGGIDKVKSKQQAHLVSLKTGKIEVLPPMKTGRCEQASIVHDNFLYVAGGMRSGSHLNSVEKFDLNKRRWSAVKPMEAKRTLFSMVVAHGLIYAIGGEDEFKCMNSVEFYDSKKNVWQNATPMIQPRASAGVAVLNNAIFAVGGSTMFKYGDTNTVERFDLDTKQWSSIASMNHSRYHVACCVYENTLFAAGGYDFASHPVDFVEIYDEKSDKWTRSKPLDKMRGSCQMFVTSSYVTAARIH